MRIVLLVNSLLSAVYYPTVKRLVWLGVGTIGLAWIGLACHKPDAVVPVVTTPPKSTPSAPLGPPLITAITIESIAPENITIDQTTKTITVVVPEVPAQVESAASVTVTAGYRLFPAGTPSTYRFNLLYGSIELTLYNESNYQVAAYKLVLKQDRPFDIGVFAQPVLSTGTKLAIPVKNYYEQTAGAMAQLTNTTTGQAFGGYVEGSAQFTNVVFVYFDSNMPSGDYTLDIVKNSGRQARAAQLISVKRGLPNARPYYWATTGTFPGTKDVRLNGVNLYTEDQVELLLTSRAGQSYKLTPTTYAPDGKSLTVDLPADIKPVPYSVQMIRKGQLVESYSRFVVRKDQNQPAIDSFYGVSLEQSPTQPVVLQRGKTQMFEPLYCPSVQKVTLKLMPVGSPATNYLVDADHTQGYFGFGPDAGYPDFTIPLSVPAGRYIITVQYLFRNESLAEGEPLERDVDLL